MAREHEADQLRIDRLNRIVEKIDKDFVAHREESLELFNMHDEEFHNKISDLDELYVELRM